MPSLPFNLSPWPSHYHMTVKNRALTASGSPKQFFAVASTTICIVFSDRLCRQTLPKTNRCTPDNGAIPFLPILFSKLIPFFQVLSRIAQGGVVFTISMEKSVYSTKGVIGKICPKNRSVYFQILKIFIVLNNS